MVTHASYPAELARYVQWVSKAKMVHLSHRPKLLASLYHYIPDSEKLMNCYPKSDL